MGNAVTAVGQVYHCNLNGGEYYKVIDKDEQGGFIVEKVESGAGSIGDIDNWQSCNVAGEGNHAGGSSYQFNGVSRLNNFVGGMDVPLGLSTEAPTANYNEAQKKALGITLVNLLTERLGSREKAIGVAASIMGESGMDPALRQGGGFVGQFTPTGHDGATRAEGLWQIDNDSRMAKMLNYARVHGLPPTSPAAQVGRMMEEAEEMGVFAKIRSGPNNAAEVCRIWTSDFEIALTPNHGYRDSQIAVVRSWF